jgi:hypothetical protein
MRRNQPPPSPEDGLRQLERMMSEKEGLKLLLLQMPPGSTMADALRLHRKLHQLRRRPCSFLDQELGIVRN